MPTVNRDTLYWGINEISSKDLLDIDDVATRGGNLCTTSQIWYPIHN